MKKVLNYSSFIKNNESILDLEKNYTHIRAYHGCSTNDVESYYKYGVVPIDEDFAKNQALQLLVDDWTPVDTVLSVFDKHWKEFDQVHRSVWFCVSRKELIESCGHYLIYGSEFISGIAAKLYRLDMLKGKGKPTIFHCDVPIKQIPEYFFESLKYNFEIGDLENCGFKIENTLSPEEIIKHDNPDLVFDPLKGNRPYNYHDFINANAPKD